MSTRNRFETVIYDEMIDNYHDYISEQDEIEIIDLAECVCELLSAYTLQGNVPEIFLDIATLIFDEYEAKMLT